MNEIDHLKLEDTAKVWWVKDPTEHSELSDICFQADLRNIQLQAIGMKELPLGLTLYMNEDTAKRDAELRLRERNQRDARKISDIARRIGIDPTTFAQMLRATDEHGRPLSADEMIENWKEEHAALRDFLNEKEVLA